MSEAQGEPKFCIMTGMTGNTSIIFQEDKIHFHATQDVKVEGAQKAPLEPLEQPEKQEPEEEGITASDIVHAGLAVLSCIPGLGTVAGLIDAGIYAAEGDLTMTGISVLAAVPVAGEAAAIAKLGTKVKTIAKISKVAGVIAKGTKVAKALKVVSKVHKFIIAAAMIKGMYENRAQIKQLLSMMLKGQFNWNDPKFLLGVATLLAQILVMKRFNKVPAKNLAEDSNKAEFKYIHNPSENPKVLRDAVEDSDAVYGYRPSESGSLKKFADGDWSDPGYVEKARQRRIDYHNENDSALQHLRDEGYSDNQIAQQMVEQRNQNRLNDYMDKDGNITDQEGYNQALEHSKSYDQLKAEGKTDQDIIKSSTKGNPGMDACTGLYDDYFDTY